MFHIVEFHADGGQMCVPGIRCFDNPEEADALVERLLNEQGHSCGSKSIKKYASDTPVENKGVIYPGIANMGREAVIIDGRLHLC